MKILHVVHSHANLVKFSWLPETGMWIQRASSFPTNISEMPRLQHERIKIYEHILLHHSSFKSATSCGDTRCLPMISRICILIHSTRFNLNVPISHVCGTFVA